MAPTPSWRPFGSALGPSDLLVSMWIVHWEIPWAWRRRSKRTQTGVFNELECIILTGGSSGLAWRFLVMEQEEESRILGVRMGIVFGA